MRLGVQAAHCSHQRGACLCGVSQQISWCAEMLQVNSAFFLVLSSFACYYWFAFLLTFFLSCLSTTADATNAHYVARLITRAMAHAQAAILEGICDMSEVGGAVTVVVERDWGCAAIASVIGFTP